MSTFNDPSSVISIGMLLRTFGGLAFVLALIYLVLHKGLGKFWLRQSANRTLKIHETLHLDAKHAIYLLGVGDKTFVVGRAENSFTVITELSSVPDNLPEMLNRSLNGASKSMPIEN